MYLKSYHAYAVPSIIMLVLLLHVVVLHYLYGHKMPIVAQVE